MVEAKKFYENSYGNVYGTDILTPEARVTFVYLKQANEKFKPAKYSVTLLFDKKTTPKEKLNELIAACQPIAAQKWGGKKATYSVPPVRDGDQETSESGKQKHPGYYFLTAKSSNQPYVYKVVNGQRVDCRDEVEPGVIVRCLITPMTYDDGFTWQLKAVRFIADDGTRFFVGSDPRDTLDELFGDGEEVASEVTPLQSVDNAVQASAPTKDAGKNGKAAALDLL